MSTSPPVRPSESLGYQINHLARMFAAAMRDRLEEHGVVPGQFAQLLALFEHDGLTQSELCGIVQIEQATMANTLKRMQRDGLIRKVQDPADGRRTLIELTPRARSLEKDLMSAAREINAAATAGMTDAEVSALLVTIETVKANLTTDR